jgi:ethanolamine transporter EutH
MVKKVKTKKRLSKVASRAIPQSQPMDSVFLLKIVMYLILGSQWVRFVDGNGTGQIPIPIGLLIGLLFAVHDHFQIDRKIEFAVLLIAMFVGFWSQIGIYITI